MAIEIKEYEGFKPETKQKPTPKKDPKDQPKK